MMDINITSNDACKIGSLILAANEGEEITISGVILHEGKTIYVGKYSYDGAEHEIDFNVTDFMDEPASLEIGDSLRIHNIKWNK